MATKGKYATHVQPKLALITGWMRNGLTLDDVAHNLGISPVTLFKYRDQHPELFEALKSGKEVADITVENALYKRALGYTCEEVTYEAGVEVKRVVKEVAPDVTAQIFWLKNRNPQAWRDKQEIDHGGKVAVEHGVQTDDANALLAALGFGPVGSTDPGDPPDGVGGSAAPTAD